MESKAVVEVIASTVRDCLEIEKGGAQRIELVSALQVGGLTPSFGLIRRAKEATMLPINVMIRPHSRSFVYDEQDIQVMLQDIDKCKQLQVNGVVFGTLDINLQIEEQCVKQLVERAEGLQITFHKAFDQTKDLLKSIQILEKFKGITRVLTQGGTQPILGNLVTLGQLTSNTSKIILLGGGLSHSNFSLLKKEFPKCQYHFGTAVRSNDIVSSDILVELLKLPGGERQ